MTFLQKLAVAVGKNNSLLCVGLDSDIHKLPPVINNSDSPQFEFNKAIIDATHDLVCAYKPNSAFYEGNGPDGIKQLKLTIDYLHQKCPDVPVILDAKRADIGNTNDGYIDYAFDYLGADAITLHPYMGREALEPFLQLKDKGIIILCRTSNPGAGELQDLRVDGQPLYQCLAEKISQSWNANGNCLLVVGATQPKEMAELRQIVGDDMIFLVPGVGAQGGDVERVIKAGINNQGSGVIINSSRSIIFASSREDFAEMARKEAASLRNEINECRK